MMQDQSTGLEEPSSKEPSLGPACLVICILGLATFSAICGIGSWFVFSNQPKLAVQAIENQLIPWVEESQLTPDDKQSIVSQLDSLVERIAADRLDKKQLQRLRNCLQDNPVLLWGGIQSIESQAASVGIKATEVESLIRLNQRVLRLITERKIGRRDLEFCLQDVSSVDNDRSHLLVRSNLSADEIRSYMQRADSLLSQGDSPNEPFEKTPAEAFEILVQAALDTSIEQSSR